MEQEHLAPLIGASSSQHRFNSEPGGRNEASFWIQQGKRQHPEGMQATSLSPQSSWAIFAKVLSACFLHALGLRCYANINFKNEGEKKATKQCDNSNLYKAMSSLQ